MIEIADIVDKDSLQKWLTDWPASQELDEKSTQQIAVTIAHRAAMRVLPYWWQWSLTKDARKRDFTALVVLRSLLTSGVAGKNPTSRIRAASDAASDFAFASAASADASAAFAAAFALAAASDASAAAFALAAAAASDAASAAADAFAAKAEAWVSVREDCAGLSGGADVFATPLWRDQENPLVPVWGDVKAQATGPEWAFWITWYDHALAGRAPNWDMLEQIALIKPAIWKAGAVAVAKEIAAIKGADPTPLEVTLDKAVQAADAAKSAAADAAGSATSAKNAATKAKKEFSALQKKYTALQKTSDQLKDLNSKQRIEVETTENALGQFKSKLDALEKDATNRIGVLEAAFSDAQALKEPVKLWREKGLMHQARATSAHRFYIFGLIASGLFVLSVFYLVVKTDIRYDLLPLGCDFRLRPELCNGFSVAAFFTVSTVLSIFTLFLWFVRLKMKEFLSERHLALDAEERRTFAQVYVGLLAMDKDVSKEAQAQRGLVYAALFRPTSDGIVKEDGGIDPSLAAMVTKALAN